MPPKIGVCLLAYPLLLPLCYKKIHVFDANLQKRLLLQYKRNSKIKSEEFAKFVANKKALITIIFGQCDEATKTKIALRATYAVNRQVGRLIKFLKQLHTVCFGSDDGGLSYGHYKQVVVVKLLTNFSNNKLQTLMATKKKSRLNMIP